ncbi:MAG: GNAT family N-acetyltransferase [Saprospiraceae bacterium]
MQGPRYTLSTFAELSATQLYEILRLRSEVFVVEQNCVYQDMDGLDLSSLHLCEWDGPKLLAYTRLIGPGVDFEDASAIGRIITCPSVRRKGHGRPIILESIKECEKHWPLVPIKLHAQSYLLKFYGEFGFKPYGEEFLEDGLPHFFMELPLA